MALRNQVVGILLVAFGTAVQADSPKIESYEATLRVLQRDEYSNEHAYRPPMERLTDGTIVVALEGEKAYTPEARWNLYWLDPISFRVKGTAKSSAALIAVKPTLNGQVLTLEYNGKFTAFDSSGKVLAQESLEKPKWSNAIYDKMFTASDDRTYFRHGDDFLYVWNAKKLKVESFKDGVLPEFETPDHKLHTLRMKDRRGYVVVATVDETGAITDTFEFSAKEVYCKKFGHRVTASGSVFIVVSNELMEHSDGKTVYELDIAKKKILRRLRSSTEEGYELYLFTHSKRLADASFMVGGYNRDEINVILFDANGKTEHRTGKTTGACGGWGSFVSMGDGSQFMVNDSSFGGWFRVYDTKTLQFVRAGNTPMHGGASLYIPQTGVFVGKYGNGIVTYSPSEKKLGLGAFSRYNYCGGIMSDETRMDDCNWNVILPSGRKWSLVTKRKRNPGYGSSGQIGELWMDRTTGYIWSDSIMNTAFSYSESADFCEQEIFNGDIWAEWSIPTQKEVVTAFDNGLYDVLPRLDSARPYSLYWYVQGKGTKAQVFDASTRKFQWWSGQGRMRCVGKPSKRTIRL